MMPPAGFDGETLPEVFGPPRPPLSAPEVHAMQAALAAVWHAVEGDAFGGEEADATNDTPLLIHPLPTMPWPDRIRSRLQPLA